MITQPSDYKFVDFANGSMYTGGFNGNILPLRQGGERNIVKAEDIAFLHECIADKAGAFKDNSIFGYHVPVYTSKLPPYGMVWSGQLYSLYKFLESELALGFTPRYASTPRGYLVRYPHEIAAFDKSGDYATYDKFIHLLDYISTTCGGTWTPTASESDFAAGKPIEVTPIANMFDDAKNLVKPAIAHDAHNGYRSVVGWVQTGGDLVTKSSDHLGWYFFDNHYPEETEVHLSCQGWFCIPSGSTVMLAEVSSDFLTDVQLWLAYSAVCMDRVPGSERDLVSSAAGLINMSAGGYCSKTQAGDKIRFRQTTLGSTNMISRIISDCGWTRQTIGSSNYIQSIEVQHATFILVGIPNARTKWWSD